MNKSVKILFTILGIIIFGSILLVFLFVQSMKPDKEKEQEVRSQAEAYLNENFSNDFEVYDTLYDNMGNFDFDYAAKAKDNKNGIQFLVHYDEEADEMVDTYVANKWAVELKNIIQPQLKERFTDSTDIVVYIDEYIGRDLNIDPMQSGSYKDANIEPTIRMNLPRHKKDGDEQAFADFISILQNEDIVKQGTFIVSYIGENGAWLEDEEWSKKF
ncbi:hypothetical protein ACUXCC_004722 [Cytobacillus horneckiae]|uniref:Uncharacterized protein n=1 Tax=Cytobacillus horneckiae TaxID=549687 RepID=A0A2N0ZF13_9BACI|nr:hypothetical protein [Cytobacillus horneckiae]MBN6889528.1 hypothetical protein [Cytobacillus horneckiae]MEC1156628.1 hypothetical protein [Cytobacillus horneckiae]MED2939150.1 hypothetical protein [Cytobacillus horneckiae]PKG28087.1 hypothetical protein CWS20_15935 [Cytobacillus horneckiae]